MCFGVIAVGEEVAGVFVDRLLLAQSRVGEVDIGRLVAVVDAAEVDVVLRVVVMGDDDPQNSLFRVNQALGGTSSNADFESRSRSI